MSDFVDLKKKWNHRWKTDPRFMKDFDYEKPEYANVPDGLKWALPLYDAANSPQELAMQKRIQEEAKAKSEALDKSNRLKSRKLSIAD